jgi:hypothetical protein
MAPFLSAPRES